MRTVLGYWRGFSVRNVDHYLLPIIAVIVALSLLPLLIEVLRNRRASAVTNAQPIPASSTAGSTPTTEGHQ